MRRLRAVAWGSEVSGVGKRYGGPSLVVVDERLNEW